MPFWLVQWSSLHAHRTQGNAIQFTVTGQAVRLLIHNTVIFERLAFARVIEHYQSVQCLSILAALMRCVCFMDAVASGVRSQSTFQPLIKAYVYCI